MFDLDGTLADTLRDISEAGNHAFTSVGRPTFPLEAYRTLAGQGLPRLIQDGLGSDYQHLFDSAIAAFRDHYAEHRFDHTQPFDGVAELLDALSDRGCKLAVLSNKPDEATCDMVRTVFGRWDFAAVRGHREGTPVKPDPTSALQVAQEVGIAPDKWWYVGDTDVDMQTGRSAGFHTVGVTWGFREEAELRDAGAHRIINDPGELLA
jgi:phosphoglycolate phosphatase